MASNKLSFIGNLILGKNMINKLTSLSCSKLKSVFLMCLLLISVQVTANGLPLEPSRQISFETSEGTWLSVDVSPNGKKIIFELLGDIYKMPIKGGEAIALTTGLPFDSQPVYSPDGKKIAFISDRSGGDQLWVSDASGDNLKQISSGYFLFASPAWANDGKSIFVSRGLPVDNIWQYNLDSSEPNQI
ncbi:MAG: hypothetical protein DRQ47_06480, partial [Gammaproteobacteria bacterium]